MTVAIVVAGLAAPALGQADDSWTDKLSFKGDFRPRFEYIDRDADSTSIPVDERKRTRFRIRFGMTAEVNDDVDVVFELASGGDNPVSTNQSFDDGFTRKEIGINLAYADWHVSDNLDVNIGKVKNPVHRAGGHHLVWDSDLNPEGLAIKYGAGNFFGSFGAFAVEERATSDDSLLFTLQGGMKFKVSDNSSLTAGIGYYDYTNTEGNSPFWIGLPFGNSVDANGDFLYDYNEVQAFVELATRFGEMPLSFFADYVQNTEAPTNDTGWAIGGKLGKVSEPGDWEASIAYQDLEADAVLALYTDSDFGGGGTDSKGFTIKGKYGMSKNWALAGTLFLNEIDLSSGNSTDYRRVQIDFEFSF